MKIHVALVEDLVHLRTDIPLFLNGFDDIHCSETFERAEDFYDAFLKDGYMPQVVLMDIDFSETRGKMSGIECIRLLREKYPKAKTQFIMFTVFHTAEEVFPALQAGAVGYILKNDRGNLAPAIRTVANEGGLMSSEISKLVMQHFHKSEQQKKSVLLEAGLTEREREVLDYLVKGFSYKKIAQELFVSVDTINSHIKHIYGKLQVNSRNEALQKIGYSTK